MNRVDLADADHETLLRYQKSLDCVHCGLCLPHCPTYRETRDEAASPRGRIYLMRGLAEGRLEINDSFAAKMDLCLVCRNCETVCPSGVEFGRMMEITRDEIDAEKPWWSPGRFVERFLLNRVVPHRGRLGFVAMLTRFYRQSGLMAFLRMTRLVRLLPKTMRAMESSLPDVPQASERVPLAHRYEPAPGIPRRGRVALLSGCVMEQLFGAINRRTVDVLTRRGYEVVVPAAQTCCGALHAHSGDMDAARSLARRNVSAFLDASPDHIVLNSAGCGAALKDYVHWLEEDADFKERARAFSAKVVDILPFFESQGLEPERPSGTRRMKAVYDAPCHLRHAQRCATAPLDVLSKVGDLELIPLPGADDCCGAAGIYNITEPEMSRRILARKLDQLASTGAEVLLTGNPGCMLQWRKGIADRRLPVRVAHPVEFL